MELKANKTRENVNKSLSTEKVLICPGCVDVYNSQIRTVVFTSWGINMNVCV